MVEDDLAVMAETERDAGRRDFDELVRRYHGELVQWAARILRDVNEAEDVVQETLGAIWKQWQENRPRDAVAYAFAAVSLNALKRHTRRRKHLPLESAGQVAEVPVRAPPDPVAMEHAIRQLPMAQQTVVRMRFYLGLSLTQIARGLSISSNTAGSRCRYALQRLRSILRSKEDEQ